ncbi:hypothetical protein MHU86_25063 [Fragilaria crotonensis]|nr:hypothetical protein MHU86_25063 [Fragilaria crotonensis]
MLARASASRGSGRRGKGESTFGSGIVGSGTRASDLPLVLGPQRGVRSRDVRRTSSFAVPGRSAPRRTVVGGRAGEAVSRPRAMSHAWRSLPSGVVVQPGLLWTDPLWVHRSAGASRGKAVRPLSFVDCEIRDGLPRDQRTTGKAERRKSCSVSRCRGPNFVFLLGGVESDEGRRMRALHCSIHALTLAVCSVVRATCEALRKQLRTHLPFKCQRQHMFGSGPLRT